MTFMPLVHTEAITSLAVHGHEKVPVCGQV